MTRPPVEPYLDLIRAKCTQVAAEHPGAIEVDDLVQEVAIWWLRADPLLLREYLDDAPGKLSRSLWRAAKRAAEKASAWYGPAEDYVHPRYTRRQVLDRLDVAIDPDGVPDGGGVPDGPKPHGNLAEGGTVLVEIIDVRRALKALPRADRYYLLRAWEARWNYPAIGAAAGVDPDSVRKRVDRLAARMARFLNREDT